MNFSSGACSSQKKKKIKEKVQLKSQQEKGMGGILALVALEWFGNGQCDPFSPISSSFFLFVVPKHVIYMHGASSYKGACRSDAEVGRETPEMTKSWTRNPDMTTTTTTNTTQKKSMASLSLSEEISLPPSPPPPKKYQKVKKKKDLLHPSSLDQVYPNT